MNFRKITADANPPLVLALFVLAGGLAAACGGAQPASGSPSAETPVAEPPKDVAAEPAAGEQEAAPSVAAKKFEEMSAPEKMEHMKKVVLPKMAKVFQESGDDEFKDVSCATCHGPGAKNGDFEMPTKGITALNQAEMDEHPKMTKFMAERVVPEMAALLGEAAYNPETHEGFGCFDCHTKKD